MTNNNYRIYSHLLIFVIIILCSFETSAYKHISLKTEFLDGYHVKMVTIISRSYRVKCEIPIPIESINELQSDSTYYAGDRKNYGEGDNYNWNVDGALLELNIGSMMKFDHLYSKFDFSETDKTCNGAIKEILWGNMAMQHRIYIFDKRNFVVFFALNISPKNKTKVDFILSHINVTFW